MKRAAPYFPAIFLNAEPMICCVLNADSDVGDDEDGVTAEAMMLLLMRLFCMRCDELSALCGGDGELSEM